MLDLLFLHLQHFKIEVLTVFLIMQAFQILDVIRNVVLFNSLLIIIEVDLILLDILQRIINVSVITTRVSLILHLDDVLIHLSLRELTVGRVLINQIEVIVLFDLK